jgi:hypothetical protein
MWRREVSGLFNRKKAEAWRKYRVITVHGVCLLTKRVVLHQATVAKRMMQGLHTVTGHKQNVLAQRPFFVWWFLGQVARYICRQCHSRRTRSHFFQGH